MLGCGIWSMRNSYSTSSKPISIFHGRSTNLTHLATLHRSYIFYFCKWIKSNVKDMSYTLFIMCLSFFNTYIPFTCIILKPKLNKLTSSHHFPPCHVLWAWIDIGQLWPIAPVGSKHRTSSVKAGVTGVTSVRCVWRWPLLLKPWWWWSLLHNWMSIVPSVFSTLSWIEKYLESSRIHIPQSAYVSIYWCQDLSDAEFLSLQ